MVSLDKGTSSATAAAVSTMRSAPAPMPVPVLYVYGTLYYRAPDGTLLRLEAEHEQGGQRRYRLTTAGRYELVRTDGVVVLACWKGIIELVEVVPDVAGHPSPQASQAQSPVSLRAALGDCA